MSDVVTPELYLKPGAMVRYTADGIEKKMSLNEVRAYRVLESYRDELHDDMSVIVPELLDYDEETQIGLLTNVGDMPHFACVQYFGDSDVYDRDYYAAVHGVASVLRKNIPQDVVSDQGDYEAVSDGRISSIGYIASGLTGNEPAVVSELLELTEAVANQTQDIIEDLPQFASHRDPNPNNYHITFRDGRKRIVVVDWETFGLSRKGYDEGRLMSYLALDARKQSDYMGYIQGVLPQHGEQVYFWRVAMNRSLREIISLHNGHYDSRLMSEYDGDIEGRRRHIVRGMTELIFSSSNRLRQLGVRV